MGGALRRRRQAPSLSVGRCAAGRAASGNYADTTARLMLQDVIPDYDDGLRRVARRSASSRRTRSGCTTSAATSPSGCTTTTLSASTASAGGGRSARARAGQAARDSRLELEAVERHRSASVGARFRRWSRATTSASGSHVTWSRDDADQQMQIRSANGMNTKLAALAALLVCCAYVMGSSLLLAAEPTEQPAAPKPAEPAPKPAQPAAKPEAAAEQPQSSAQSAASIHTDQRVTSPKRRAPRHRARPGSPTPKKAAASAATRRARRNASCPRSRCAPTSTCHSRSTSDIAICDERSTSMVTAAAPAAHSPRISTIRASSSGRCLR